MLNEKQFKQKLIDKGFRVEIDSSYCKRFLTKFNNCNNKCESYNGCVKFGDYCTALLCHKFRGNSPEWLNKKAMKILGIDFL